MPSLSKSSVLPFCESGLKMTHMLLSPRHNVHPPHACFVARADIFLLLLLHKSNNLFTSPLPEASFSTAARNLWCTVGKWTSLAIRTFSWLLLILQWNTWCLYWNIIWSVLQIFIRVIWVSQHSCEAALLPPTRSLRTTKCVCREVKWCYPRRVMSQWLSRKLNSEALAPQTQPGCVTTARLITQSPTQQTGRCASFMPGFSLLNANSAKQQQPVQVGRSSGCSKLCSVQDTRNRACPGAPEPREDSKHSEGPRLRLLRGAMLWALHHLVLEWSWHVAWSRKGWGFWASDLRSVCMVEVYPLGQNFYEKEKSYWEEMVKWTVFFSCIVGLCWFDFKFFPCWKRNDGKKLTQSEIFPFRMLLQGYLAP